MQRAVAATPAEIFRVLSDPQGSWKDAAIFPVIPESALRATLGILARTVAPGKPRPAIPAS